MRLAFRNTSAVSLRRVTSVLLASALSAYALGASAEEGQPVNGGTVIAALLIGVSDGVISVFFSPTLAKMIATLAVALVLVFRPQGLFGTVAR